MIGDWWGIRKNAPNAFENRIAPAGNPLGW